MTNKGLKVYSRRSFGGGIVQVDYSKVPENAVYDMLDYHINIDGTLTKRQLEEVFTTNYQSRGWKEVRGLFHDGTALYVVDGANNRILYTTDNGGTWGVKSYPNTPWHYLSPFYRDISWGEYPYIMARWSLNGAIYQAVIRLNASPISEDIVKLYEVTSVSLWSGVRGVRFSSDEIYFYWGQYSGGDFVYYDDLTNSYNFTYYPSDTPQAVAGVYYTTTVRYIVIIYKDYNGERGEVLKVYYDSGVSDWTYTSLGTFTFSDDSDFTAFDVVFGEYDTVNKVFPFYIAGYKDNGTDEDLVVEVFTVDVTDDSISYKTELSGFALSGNYSASNEENRITVRGDVVYFYSSSNDVIYQVNKDTGSLISTIENFDVIDSQDFALGYANDRIIQVIGTDIREIDSSGNSDILMFDEHDFNGEHFQFSGSHIFPSSIGAVITGDYTPYIRGDGFITPLRFNNFTLSTTPGTDYFIVPKIVIKKDDLEFTLWGIGRTNGDVFIRYYDLLPLVEGNTIVELYGEVYEKNADGDYILAYRNKIIPGVYTKIMTSVSNGEMLTINGVFPPNDPPPENAVVGAFYKGRLVLAKGNRIYWSGINWKFDNTYYWLDVGTSEIVALVPFRNVLYIFTSDNRIYELSGEFPVLGVNYGINASSLLSLREVSAIFGNLRPESIISTMEGIYFLTDTNLWLFNGFSVTPLIKLGAVFVDSVYASTKMTQDGYLVVMTGTDYTYIYNETLKAIEKHGVNIGRTIYASGWGKLIGVNPNNPRELWNIMDDNPVGKGTSPTAYVMIPWVGEDTGVLKVIRQIAVEGEGTGYVNIEADGNYVSPTDLYQASGKKLKINARGHEFLIKLRDFDDIKEFWMAYVDRAWKRKI